MEPPMIQAFQELDDNDSRTAALDALVRYLTPYEWRHLAHRLQARTFQTDIVGTLPVEIVAVIFAYLDPSAPFRLRAVSKRWCALLQSPAVWKSSVRAWYDDLLPSDLDEVAFDLKARAIHKFRAGRWLDLDKWFLEPRRSYASVFCEDMFAYVKRDERAVEMFDLQNRSGTLRTLMGRARERIARLTLSDRFIAFNTYDASRNNCHVFDLAGEPKASISLHPHMDEVFVSRGPLLVCGGHLPAGVELYVWDFDTQRGTTFTIPAHHPLLRPLPERNQCTNRLVAVLPNPDAQTITVFLSNACDMPHCTNSRISCTIYYTRFTCAGRELESAAFTLSQVYGVQLDSFYPVDRRGTFALELTIVYEPLFYAFSKKGMTSTLASVLFDETTFTFKDSKCPASFPLPSHLLPVSVKQWKDTFYQAWPSTGKFPLAEGVLTELSGLRLPLAFVGTSSDIPLSDDPEESGSSMTPESAFYLNDKYAVLLDENSGLLSIVSFHNAYAERRTSF